MGYKTFEATNEKQKLFFCLFFYILSSGVGLVTLIVLALYLHMLSVSYLRAGSHDILDTGIGFWNGYLSKPTWITAQVYMKVGVMYGIIKTLCHVPNNQVLIEFPMGKPLDNTVQITGLWFCSLVLDFAPWLGLRFNRMALIFLKCCSSIHNSVLVPGLGNTEQRHRLTSGVDNTALPDCKNPPLDTLLPTF